MNNENVEILDVELEESSEEFVVVEAKTELVFPELENIIITPTTEKQEFNHPDSYGYDKVIVEPLQGEEINIIPTTEKQQYEGVYSKVKVEAIQDENLKPENIKNGVEILGVVGNLPSGKYKPRYINTLNFSGYTGTELDYEINNLDTSNIINMSSMFNVCKNLISLDLSNFNTSNVDNMYQMFYGCTNLTELNLSNFDTSNVTTMANLFYGCTNLTELNLSSFNTSKANIFDAMFRNCKKLVSLDLSNFDTNNVNRMEHMFNGCSSLTELNLKNWNSENVTNLYGFVRDCSKLQSLDLSSFYTPNLTNTNYMFYGCQNLTNLDIRNFTFDKVTSSSNMFSNVPKDCLITVKSQTEKQWILARRSDFTNIKVIADQWLRTVTYKTKTLTFYAPEYYGYKYGLIITPTDNASSGNSSTYYFLSNEPLAYHTNKWISGTYDDIDQTYLYKSNGISPSLTLSNFSNRTGDYGLNTDQYIIKWSNYDVPEVSGSPNTSTGNIKHYADE